MRTSNPQFIWAADKFNILGTDRITLLNLGLNDRTYILLYNTLHTLQNENVTRFILFNIISLRNV